MRLPFIFNFTENNMQLIPWIIFITVGQFSLVLTLPRQIHIGGVFDDFFESQEVAFKHAIDRINANPKILPRSELVHQIRKINTRDRYNVTQTVCLLMSTGVAAIFGPQSAANAAHVQSICDALEVPHIQARWDFRLSKDVHSINLHPHSPTLSRAYKDLVRQWQWNKFAILYENDDGLVKLKELFMTPVKSPSRFTVHQLPPGPSYRDVLWELMKLDQKHIIVDCGTDKVFQVLKQAQQVGMMTASHHYLLTSLDVDTINLEEFRHAGTNITSLRLVNRTHAEVQKVVRQLEWILHDDSGPAATRNFTLRTETALVFDAVYLFAKALHNLNAVHHIDIKPLSCKSEKAWVAGNSLINYIKVVQLEGLSGIIGFDTYGFRSRFDLDIMELHRTGLEKIGYWSSRYQDHKSRLHFTKILGREDYGSMRNKTLNVTVLMNAPYTMRKDSVVPLHGNDRFEGFSIDLIEEIADIVHFNYTIYEVPDKSYGAKDKATNSWNGLIGELTQKRADLAVGDITITLQRQEAVDFTTPFMNLGISIMFRKPAKAPLSWTSFLSPFSSEVWLYMVIAYLGTTLVLIVLARLSPCEWDNPYPCILEPDALQNDFGILNSMWFTIGFVMQQGTDIAPRGASTRLVAGTWAFFTLIMISTYKANLVAFLVVENLESTIKDVQDVARNPKIKCGSVATGSTRIFFETSNISIYKQIWSRMSVDGLVNGNHDGMERVIRGNYAFFIESTSNEYLVERNCNVTMVAGLLDNKGYGIALPKDSPYKTRITAAILRLQEDGKLDKLKTKWWKQKKRGDLCEDKGGGIKSMGLAHVRGIFAILFGGVGLASIISVSEFIWKTRRSPTYERGSLCREIIKELTSAVMCKGSKKIAKKTPSKPETVQAARSEVIL